MADIFERANLNYLSALYNDFNGHDCTIFVGPQPTRFTAHKMILAQSSFFRAAFAPGTFKEGITGIMYLPEDRADDIERLISFLYQAKYLYMYPSLDERPEDEDLPVHIRMFLVGDKFDLPRLQQRALNWLLEEIEEEQENRVAHGGRGFESPSVHEPLLRTIKLMFEHVPVSFDSGIWHDKLTRELIERVSFPFNGLDYQNNRNKLTSKIGKLLTAIPEFAKMFGLLMVDELFYRRLYVQMYDVDEEGLYF